MSTKRLKPISKNQKILLTFSKDRWTPSNKPKPSELAKRFANMSLKEKEKPPSSHQDLQDRIAKRIPMRIASGSGSAQKVPQPALPNYLFIALKEAVDIINRPGGLQDPKNIIELETAEEKIRLACKFYSNVMPPDWKYDRENASSLVVGYDMIFRVVGHQYIV